MEISAEVLESLSKDELDEALKHIQALRDLGLDVVEDEVEEDIRTEYQAREDNEEDEEE